MEKLLPYFIKYSVNMSVVCTFILQSYLNTLFMNKGGEWYHPSIMCKEYFSIIFNEKSSQYTQNTVGKVLTKLNLLANDKHSSLINWRIKYDKNSYKIYHEVLLKEKIF